MTQYFCALPLNLSTNSNLVRLVKVRYQRLFKFDEGLDFWSPTPTPTPDHVQLFLQTSSSWKTNSTRPIIERKCKWWKSFLATFMSEKVVVLGKVRRIRPLPATVVGVSGSNLAPTTEHFFDPSVLLPSRRVVARVMNNFCVFSFAAMNARHSFILSFFWNIRCCWLRGSSFVSLSSLSAMAERLVLLRAWL